MFDELPAETVQRTINLSDEAWSAALARAELERTSASEICGQLLAAYLVLEEKPRPAVRPPGLTGRKRSIYVTDPVWAAAKAQKARERRSVSAILEQLLRDYLGLDVAGQ